MATCVRACVCVWGGGWDAFCMMCAPHTCNCVRPAAAWRVPAMAPWHSAAALSRAGRRHAPARRLRTHHLVGLPVDGFPHAAVGAIAQLLHNFVPATRGVRRGVLRCYAWRGSARACRQVRRPTAHTLLTTRRLTATHAARLRGGCVAHSGCICTRGWARARALHRQLTLRQVGAGTRQQCAQMLLQAGTAPRSTRRVVAAPRHVEHARCARSTARRTHARTHARTCSCWRARASTRPRHRPPTRGRLGLPGQVSAAVHAACEGARAVGKTLARFTTHTPHATLGCNVIRRCLWPGCVA
jgi:hypothetical protein